MKRSGMSREKLWSGVSGAEPLTGRLDAATIWVRLVRPAAIPVDAHARLAAILSEQERTKIDAFRTPLLRHTALVTRALVRRTLSAIGEVAPSEIVFGENEHGRPEIDAPSALRDVRFSVSHDAGEDGLIAIACARSRDVGIDLEPIALRPTVDMRQIATRFFAPAERDILRGLEGAPLREAFVALWTMKEAYAKARGLGVALPFELFACRPEPAGGRLTWIDPTLDDDPSAWVFFRRNTPRHTLALVVHRAAPVDLCFEDVDGMSLTEDDAHETFIS
jgi:4'-phosphopantetheinyl transferase